MATRVPALDAGLRLLARRGHAVAELRRKLGRRGYDEGEIDDAVSRLTELGYLDDAAFAASLATRRSGSRGRRAIAAELAHLGVDRESADTALAGMEPEVELAAAVRLARRLAPGAAGMSRRERLDLIGSKLLRRGFSPHVAAAACIGLSGDP